MGRAVRLTGEHQKNIVKLMDSLCGRFSKWEVWQDFIVMSAITIANAMGGPHRESREEEYLSRAQKYSANDLEVFAQMLTEVVREMDRNPDQDFLGELFMVLDLGNEWKGQFFTPYSVCRATAAMICGNGIKDRISKQGWVSVNDPACGAGSLLIAFANECRRPRNAINYQTCVLFVAQDIDCLAGCMCYIQLSLLGCPGYVVIDNTLTRPNTSHDGRGLIPVDGPNVWYTPFFFRNVWKYRRLLAQAGDLFQSASASSASKPTAPATAEPSRTDEDSFHVTQTGQFSLF